MNWTKLSEKKPTKDGQYLTVVKIFGRYFYEVHHWANNLRDTHLLDFNEVRYERGGFWDSDPEWGEHELLNVIAWCEIEEYK